MRGWPPFHRYYQNCPTEPRRHGPAACTGGGVLNSKSDGQECLSHTSYSIPSSFANAFHLPSTNALVFASITISSGQGRGKPSVGHLRVASMPIFEPQLARREAWSGEATGAGV